MGLVENAWAGFGSAFGPVVILSLFWRRFTYKGALAGVISGALVDVLWLAFLSGPTGIYELIPGFAVSMVVAIVATLLDKKPSDDITAIFDAATAKADEKVAAAIEGHMIVKEISVPGRIINIVIK